MTRPAEETGVVTACELVDLSGQRLASGMGAFPSRSERCVGDVAGQCKPDDTRTEG